MGKNAPLLTLAEVAAKFNIPEAEIKDMADRRILGHIKQERETGTITYMFPEDELVGKLQPRLRPPSKLPDPVPRVPDKDGGPIPVIHPKVQPKELKPPAKKRPAKKKTTK